jgi:hypothetical protein
MWHMQLGNAHFQLGDTELAATHLRESLSLLGTKLPSGAAGNAVFMARQIVRQVRDLTLGRPSVSRGAERLAIASAAASQLAWVNNVRRDIGGVMSMALLSVNLADRAGTTSIMGLSVLGAAASALKMRNLGRRYLDRARTEGRRRPVSRDFLLELMFDAMDLIGSGDVPGSVATLAEGVAAARRSSGRTMLGSLLGLSGVIDAMAGRFGSAGEFVREAAALVAGQPSHERYHVLNISVIVDGYRRTGAEGLELYRSMESVLMETMEPGDSQAQSSFIATKALLLFRGGEFAAAEQANDESFAMQTAGFRTVPPAQWASIEGTPEIYVGLWERANAEGRDASAIRAKALRSEKLLARFAKNHPVYAARLAIVRGEIAALDGHGGKAAQLFQQGAEAAGRLQLRFDEALAFFEQARLHPAGSADREKHLAIARAMFTECGAQHELDRVAALGG